MFYSQVLLAKKGTLGKVWLAAHQDRKLTKQQIGNSDIRSLVVSVSKPQAALSLRVSAHLLLGLSRIFQRQVMYLYMESNEALVRIRAVSSCAGRAIRSLREARGREKSPCCCCARPREE